MQLTLTRGWRSRVWRVCTWARRHSTPASPRVAWSVRTRRTPTSRWRHRSIRSSRACRCSVTCSATRPSKDIKQQYWHWKSKMTSSLFLLLRIFKRTLYFSIYWKLFFTKNRQSSTNGLFCVVSNCYFFMTFLLFFAHASNCSVRGGSSIVHAHELWRHDWVKAIDNKTFTELRIYKVRISEWISHRQ